MLFASFAENVVRVVDFRLGRLENTAPVHKSKLRKRVDFYSVSGACFLKGFVLHTVPDPPRNRRASVTHDPKRGMCYDQPWRACLG